MTRQEKIREGISQRLHMGQLSIGLDVIRDKDAPTSYKADLVEAGIQKMLDEILSYLHSQGVVIKVEKGLPWNEDIPKEYNELACGAEDATDNIAKAAYELSQQDMLKDGYTATGPLIEVEKEKNEWS